MSKIRFFKYRNSIPSQLIDGQVMYDATSMAKPFGKRPNDFLSLPSTNKLKKAITQEYGVREAQLVTTIRGGLNPGTWMHEYVAIDFARWLSPAYGIWFRECMECSRRKNCLGWKGVFFSIGKWTLSKLSSKDQEIPRDL